MAYPRPLRMLMMKVLRAGGASCPECQMTVPLPSGGDDLEVVVCCPGCGRYGSLAEFALSERYRKPPSGPGAGDQPPPGTKIVKRELKGGGCSWEIPPSGRGVFFLFFAGVWMLPTVGVTAGLLYEVITEGADPWPLLFLSLFWAVGIGMTYAGLRTRYARHLVIVDAKSVILGRSLFGRRKLKSFPRESIRAVHKKEFYQQNYQPVYGIEIRGERGKLRFGSSLTEEEKDWLVGDLREALTLSRPAGQPAPATWQREQRFVMELPRERPGGGIGGALVLIAVAGGFVTLGVLVMQDAGFFRYLWIAFSSLFLLGGFAALVTSIRSIGVKRELTVTPHELRWRKARNGSVLEERSVPRKEIVAVRCFVSGSKNSEPAYWAEVVGRERSLALVTWSSSERWPEVTGELAARLGVEGPGLVVDGELPD